MALLLVLAVVENVVYRQLTVVWRLKGLASTFRKKQVWGVMTRTGFSAT